MESWGLHIFMLSGGRDWFAWDWPEDLDRLNATKIPKPLALSYELINK